MQGGSVVLVSAGVLSVLLGLLAVGCSAAIESARGGSGASISGLTRPDRPRVFHTPEELRHYLDAVSNYYAVASRPGRFGKRSSPRLSRAGPGPLQREERVSMLRRDDDLDLDSVEPDYLLQFGAAPSPSSDVFPLFLEQERLTQSRPNQAQE